MYLIFRIRYKLALLYLPRTTRADLFGDLDFGDPTAEIAPKKRAELPDYLKPKPKKGPRPPPGQPPSKPKTHKPISTTRPHGAVPAAFPGVSAPAQESATTHADTAAAATTSAVNTATPAAAPVVPDEDEFSGFGATNADEDNDGDDTTADLFGNSAAPKSQTDAALFQDDDNSADVDSHNLDNVYIPADAVEKRTTTPQATAVQKDADLLNLPSNAALAKFESEDKSQEHVSVSVAQEATSTNDEIDGDLDDDLFNMVETTDADNQIDDSFDFSSYIAQQQGSESGGLFSNTDE
jgi:hypothetical protein